MVASVWVDKNITDELNLTGGIFLVAEYGLSLWMECALGYIPITINSCAVLNHERQRNIQGYSINDMGLLRTS